MIALIKNKNQLFHVYRDFTFYFTFIFIYFIFMKLSFVLSEEMIKCEKSKPIYKNNSCELIYCSQLEFDNEECFIANDIVKTQWLNNIKMITPDCPYIYYDWTVGSKGNLIIGASLGFNVNTTINQRTFYSIRANGLPYFYDSNTKKFITTKSLQYEYFGSEKGR